MCPPWQTALAELKKGTKEVNPDEESLQRLKLLRGEAAAPAAKPKPSFRTAQVLSCPFPAAAACRSARGRAMSEQLATRWAGYGDRFSRLRAPLNTLLIALHHQQAASLCASPISPNFLGVLLAENHAWRRFLRLT